MERFSSPAQHVEDRDEAREAVRHPVSQLKRRAVARTKRRPPLRRHAR